ncbi:MAG: hypothetical protein ABIF08_03910 [Nanoarchaeota archaeon]
MATTVFIMLAMMVVPPLTLTGYGLVIGVIELVRVMLSVWLKVSL